MSTEQRLLDKEGIVACVHHNVTLIEGKPLARRSFTEQPESAATLPVGGAS